MKEVIKHYTKEDVTVIWQPAMCIHSKICFHGLPQVFNPENRPWVQLDETSTDKIIAQVKECPSGALSIKGDEINVNQSATHMSVTKSGPLLVKGDLTIELADGEKVEKTGMTALCRCGASENKPYCDGSHQKIEFDT